MTAVLRAALIGCGRRGSSTYLPVLAGMDRHFRVVAVCDPDQERAAGAAARTGARPYRRLEDVLEHARPDVCVVCVTPPPDPANGAALLACIRAGVPALAETPVALTLAEADRLVAEAGRAGVPVEIAENYVRQPRHRYVRALLAAGLFGAVTVAYSDFVGHGYHGLALLRGYVGADRTVVRVTGDRQRFDVEPHRQRNDQVAREELWQFGVLTFDDGARGVFSFSTLAYHSPLRPRATAAVRFLATRGMGAGDALTTLDAGPLVVAPVLERIRGVEVPAALTATGTDLVWENPLRDYPLPDGDQHGPLTIGLQLLALHRAVTEGAAPEYGLATARYDRLLDLALQRSWDTGGPVTL